MPSNVLVPIDGSEQAIAGLEYCFASFPDATITALYVVDPGYDNYASVGERESIEDRAQAAADRILDRARTRADDRGHELETAVRTGSPQTEILEHVVAEDVDHVVMGSHGESPITRPFLGHVSEAVVRRAPVSTSVVSEPPADLTQRDLPGRILVPVDGSEQADAALEYALEAFPDATIAVVHVVDLPFETGHDEVGGTYLESIRDEFDERADEILASAETIADEQGRSVETASIYGDPKSEIVEYALEAECDQIVMGGHGRSLAARLVTGTVAETVTRRSSITVTLVRGRPD
ncbi:universal stress protein [Natrialbaceae archaeon AArc-T1-2]|uniref:universal stress protein n=1 Tax=Natrialbaceae archaeon AArc-T1-2 TaxID=3053904 RepID=UPI00255B0245|nr:universal stress protein [Natrialbaceae archaeon AArc-T1-2]WIV65877.1 universal stress protein [Natrialbaceae archaeon AArc-T1-2]